MSNHNTDSRIETDLLGPVEVPAKAQYGAQTQRSLDIFPLHGEKRFCDYPELLKAMLLVKKATVIANQRAKTLDYELGKAIIQVIDSLIQETPDDQFTVHSFHGGGGISFNMNINEVIANIANQKIFDHPYGTYQPVHPNNHVNLNQSTSDVFSTASHIAVITKWAPLAQELEQLALTFNKLGQKWEDVQKISRTCLQDAVEISFADFFSGYRDFVKREHGRMTHAVSELYAINLGGTIVGRACDADASYSREIIAAFLEIANEVRYHQSPNLFDSAQNLDDLVHVSSHLNILARGLIKIGQDIRLLSSGPQTGFGEINLPAVQPGSSALPGKVNPTVPEFLIQCCFQVAGKCAAAEMILDHGELDLNVWGAVLVTNLLDSIACLENGIRVFRKHCLEGLEVNLEKNRENTQTVIPLITQLKLLKGYSFAVDVFKKTQGNIAEIKRYLEDAKIESSE